MYPEAIKQVELNLIGLQHYIDRFMVNYPTITWEILYKKINDPKIKNEIFKGLNYQSKFHPIALKDWIISHNL